MIFIRYKIVLLILTIIFISNFNISPAYSNDDALNFYQKGMELQKYGKYIEAQSYYEKSLRIYQKSNSIEGISANLNNIGLIHSFIGKYDKALLYLIQSLDIKKENNFPPQSIALSLNNIGFIYDSIGEYENAVIFYEEALKIDRGINDPLDIATDLNNIGAAYNSSGSHEKRSEEHTSEL